MQLRCLGFRNNTEGKCKSDGPCMFEIYNARNFDFNLTYASTSNLDNTCHHFWKNAKTRSFFYYEDYMYFYNPKYNKYTRMTFKRLQPIKRKPK